MSEQEQRIWRAYLLGKNHSYGERGIGLGELLVAIASDEAFDRAIEPREAMLERQLQEERGARIALESSLEPTCP